jgi:hypothetical protein
MESVGRVLKSWKEERFAGETRVKQTVPRDS